MKFPALFLSVLALAAAAPLAAQPSFAGPMPSREVTQGADQRRREYLARIDEGITWRLAQAKPGDPLNRDVLALKLARRIDPAQCSRDVIEYMKEPGNGPFWMFPVVALAELGRDQLTPEAKAAIRDGWRKDVQWRGDTENHWAMYYTSLYLMSELYPNEPGDTWYTGKSSAENLAEAREYLISWMDLATTVGQGEFNPTHYIGEYAIPMLYLASWAKDPAMRQRGHMMLDWIFADLAANTLHGVLRGANARTDDTSVLERWNALASFFSWINFGNTAPTASYGGWGVYYFVAAENYQVPEVIYRIATDRDADYTQRDLKRTRRRWRGSDVLFEPIYKTSYMRQDYAVGSFQGAYADPIQAHVWDVTWDVADPRGVHNTMFSLHPYSSAVGMQMYFSDYPDPMIHGAVDLGKPSYNSPDKLVGSSPYEQVWQDRDTVIALYDIAPGTHYERVNGFFSKDLKNVTEDKSGWIFAQGGRTYLAYRPLAPYTWEPALLWRQLPVPVGYSWTRDDKGDKLLDSPHPKNGTIIQAASASEFKDFAAFQAAIRALPLTFSLAPTPTVTMTTLRGTKVTATYGSAPVVNGQPLDYAATWKLYQGPYLNAEKGSHKLTITHGNLERTLDFNTLTISDRVK